MREFLQWLVVLFNTSVWLTTSTIIALALSTLSALQGKPSYARALLGIAALTFLLANFFSWRAEHRSRLTAQADLQAERDTRGRIVDVYPWLRYAYGLEGYDGSSERGGERDKVITRSSPPVTLHFDRYSEKNPAFFVFGVYNGNKKAPIKIVNLTIKFPNEDVRVTYKGAWVSNLDNYEYVTGFPLIPAQVAQNGDKLGVLFPRPGTYTIRIEINALDLGQVTYDLSVILD